MNCLTEEIKTADRPMPREVVPSGRGLISAEEVNALEQFWRTDRRWEGTLRNYSAGKVLRLRGTMKIEHTIAGRMARKLWDRLNNGSYVNALGAFTGNQAV